MTSLMTPVWGCDLLTDASLASLCSDARWGVSRKVYQYIDGGAVMLVWRTGWRWLRWGWDALCAEDQEWLGAGAAHSLRQARRRATKVRRGHAHASLEIGGQSNG